MKLPDLDELVVMRGKAQALTLQARGAAQALLLGNHRSHHRGRGLEFEEVRPYVAGDDLRSIDWRVTARRGRVHTKLFREERERPVWLLVDLNPAMFFGSRLQLKSMVAVRAAALLAWVAAHRGDRVGAVIANGTHIRVLPPRSREAGVLPLLDALVELQPTAPQAVAPQSFNIALQNLTPLVHPGSLVLTFSDFATLDANDQARWSRLIAHSECRWFWITDALEQQALPNGRFRVGQPRQIVPIDGESIRSKWLAAWQQRATLVTNCAQSLRIPLMRLDTGAAVVDTLQSLLHLSKSVA